MPKFLTQLDAQALLNFLGQYQCDTHDMHNRFLPTASDSAIWAGGKNSHMSMEVQGHKCPTPSPRHLLVKKKWLDTFWSGHVHSPKWLA